MKKELKTCSWCNAFLAEETPRKTCFECAKRFDELPESLMYVRLFGIKMSAFLKSFFIALFSSVTITTSIVAAICSFACPTEVGEVITIVGALFSMVIVTPVVWMEIFSRIHRNLCRSNF